MVSQAHTNLFSYGGKLPAGEQTDEDRAKADAAMARRATPSTLDDQAPNDPPQQHWLDGGWHNGTEEMLESWRTGWQGGEPVDRPWESVNVGDTIPTLVMPITVTRCVLPQGRLA